MFFELRRLIEEIYERSTDFFVDTRFLKTRWTGHTETEALLENACHNGE